MSQPLDQYEPFVDENRRVTPDWYRWLAQGASFDGPLIYIDPDSGRINLKNNSNYDLAGGVLAVNFLQSPSSVVVPDGKVFNFERISLESGNQIPVTVGNGSVAAGNMTFLELTSSSHATSALYHTIGTVFNSGPGTAKALYGRGTGLTGCTGVVMGLVGAVDAVAGMSTACALQLDYSSGPDDLGIFQLWESSGGKRLQAGITSLAAIKYNAVVYRAWMHSGSAAGATAWDLFDETPTRLAYIGKIGDAHFPTLEVTGGQITFPATQNPSSNANTLDDYEEGTFTPVLEFGGGSTGITYSTQTGKYTKIGNVVHVWIALVLTSKGSSVGNASVTGLPFTAGDSAVSVVTLNNMTAAAIDFPVAAVSNGTTAINISKYSTAAGTNTAVADTDFSNTSIVRFNLIYPV